MDVKNLFLLLQCLEKATTQEEKEILISNEGGIPNPKGMVPEPLSPFLQVLANHLKAINVFPEPPNHVCTSNHFTLQLTKEVGVVE